MNPLRTLTSLLLIATVALAGSALYAPLGATTHPAANACTPPVGVGAASVSAACPTARILAASTTYPGWWTPAKSGVWEKVPGLELRVPVLAPSTLDISFNLQGSGSGCSDSLYSALFVDGAIVKAAGGRELVSTLSTPGTLSGLHVATSEGGSPTVEVKISSSCPSQAVAGGILRVGIHPL